MKATWALIADNSEARLYKLRTHPNRIELIDQAEHEQGRWHNGDFITSRPGRTASAMGKMSNRSVGNEDTAKREESRYFAHALAEDLNDAFQQNAFGTLHICAPAKLMGELVSQLDKHIPVAQKVSKDLIKSSDEQILQNLTVH